MKISIITLHSVCNYGTQLQALATQEKLKEYFDEIEFINYKRFDTYGKGLIKSYSKNSLLRLVAFLPTYYKWKKVFGNFQKKYLNINPREYLNQNDLNNYIDDADIYMTGSDQVWNTGWNGGVIPAFYLNFINDNKPRYAYASSFGKNKLTDDEVKESKKYIDKFRKISVREASGVDILKKQYKYENVINIIDPTLVITPEVWRKYEKPCKIKDDYILIYSLNKNNKLDKYAKDLAKKTGLKLYRFCTRYDQILKTGKGIVIPEILDFVTLVDNAKYVITDSFHATAFSINMGTEPICIYPSNYSGRISEFLKLVDCQDRHLKSYDDFNIINRHINFEKVQRILEKERMKVDDYLEEIKKENEK